MNDDNPKDYTYHKTEYRDVVKGGALAAVAALFFSAEQIATKKLPRTPEDFSLQILDRLADVPHFVANPSSEYVWRFMFGIAIAQLVTGFCFVIANSFFVWERAEEIAEQNMSYYEAGLRSKQKRLLVYEVFGFGFTGLACVVSATSILGFRFFGLMAAVFWYLRIRNDQKLVDGELKAVPAFGDAARRFGFVSWAAMSIVFFVVGQATASQEGHALFVQGATAVAALVAIAASSVLLTDRRWWRVVLSVAAFLVVFFAGAIVATLADNRVINDAIIFFLMTIIPLIASLAALFYFTLEIGKKELPEFLARVGRRVRNVTRLRLVFQAAPNEEKEP